MQTGGWRSKQSIFFLTTGGVIWAVACCSLLERRSQRSLVVGPAGPAGLSCTVRVRRSTEWAAESINCGRRACSTSAVSSWAPGRSLCLKRYTVEHKSWFLYPRKVERLGEDRTLGDGLWAIRMQLRKDQVKVWACILGRNPTYIFCSRQRQ